MSLSALEVLGANYEAMLWPIEIAGRSAAVIIFGGVPGESLAAYAGLVMWVPKNRRALGLRQLVRLGSLAAEGKLFTKG